MFAISSGKTSSAPSLSPNSRESWLPADRPLKLIPAHLLLTSASYLQLHLFILVHWKRSIFPAWSNVRQSYCIWIKALMHLAKIRTQTAERTEIIFSMTYASCPHHPAHDKHSSQTSLPSSCKHLPILYFCSIALWWKTSTSKQIVAHQLASMYLEIFSSFTFWCCIISIRAKAETLREF